MKITKTRLKQIIKEELEEALAKNIKVEKLPNGLYLLFDYGSQLSGLYNADGSMRHGSLKLNKEFVQTKIAELTKWNYYENTTNYVMGESAKTF